mmetsp:Transcript_46602/g.101176  ORF Transcript_46602/g.101176 Transcript_46602/m.101176 type:complete len:372 (+) Transcript_46602:109-1224(+)
MPLHPPHGAAPQPPACDGYACSVAASPRLPSSAYASLAYPSRAYPCRPSPPHCRHASSYPHLALPPSRPRLLPQHLASSRRRRGLPTLGQPLHARPVLPTHAPRLLPLPRVPPAVPPPQLLPTPRASTLHHPSSPQPRPRRLQLLGRAVHSGSLHWLHPRRLHPVRRVPSHPPPPSPLLPRWLTGGAARWRHQGCGGPSPWRQGGDDVDVWCRRVLRGLLLRPSRQGRHVSVCLPRRRRSSSLSLGRSLHPRFHVGLSRLCPPAARSQCPSRHDGLGLARQRHSLARRRPGRPCGGGVASGAVQPLCRRPRTPPCRRRRRRLDAQLLVSRCRCVRRPRALGPLGLRRRPPTRPRPLLPHGAAMGRECPGPP